jgi:hypothetical protein
MEMSITARIPTPPVKSETPATLPTRAVKAWLVSFSEARSWVWSWMVKSSSLSAGRRWLRRRRPVRRSGRTAMASGLSASTRMVWR